MINVNDELYSALYKFLVFFFKSLNPRVNANHILWTFLTAMFTHIWS
eukprot:COSAG02_NODE_46281_length_350_cov_0.808765_1_plen_46_part_10